MSIGLQTQATQVATGGHTTKIAVCSTDDGLLDRVLAAFQRLGERIEVLAIRDELTPSAFEGESWDGVLLDFESAHAEMKDRLRELAERFPELSIVVAVPDSAAEGSPALLRAGATGVACRDWKAEALASATILGAENAHLVRELRILENRLKGVEVQDGFVGCSPAIRRLAGVVDRAGENDATVLIEGNEGAGRTLVARLIHTRGRRSERPFVALHSQDVDEPLLEGSLQRAEGGTLLIEDVERMAASCQSRLVRYLKDRGGVNDGKRDVRIIATTSARLAELTAKGAFREDLYYRLNMFPVVVPTLQERREDIPLLATHFLAQSTDRNGFPDKGFTPPAMIMLEAHPWPGNVAQLRNTIMRAHALADGGPIDRIHLFGPSTGVTPPPGVAGFSDDLSGDDSDDVSEDDILPFQEEEKRILNRALQATRGNVRRAAQLLGIGRATLYRKIQVYQLRLQ